MKLLKEEGIKSLGANIRCIVNVFSVKSVLTLFGEFVFISYFCNKYKNKMEGM